MRARTHNFSSGTYELIKTVVKGSARCGVWRSTDELVGLAETLPSNPLLRLQSVVETFTVSGWFGASTAEVTLKLRPSFCPGARPQLDVSPLQ